MRRCPAIVDFARLAALVALVTLSGCMSSYEVNEPSTDRLECLERAEKTPILWLSPVGDGENRSLETWCRNNGPPVVKPNPAGDFSAANSDSIDILVWNVEVGDGWVTEFLDQNTEIDCDGSNSTMGGNGLHFVFLTQESLRRSDDIPEDVTKGGLLPRVGGNAHPGAILDIIQVADRCGLSLFYLPGSRNGAEKFAGLYEDKGNAILSTLPLSDFAGIELPFESVRRIVPVATVTTPGGRQVRVASVHVITTPPPWRVIMTGNTARERQSLGLINGLEKIESVYGEISTVAAGDLNTFSNRETSLRKLRRYFSASPPPFGKPTRGPVQADHILFRQRAFFESMADHIVPGSYERVDELYYSDHYPVRARLRFGN